MCMPFSTVTFNGDAFAGDEFYMKEWPQLTGKSFMEVLVSFPEAIPLGIRNSSGLLINPDDNYIMQPGAWALMAPGVHLLCSRPTKHQPPA